MIRTLSIRNFKSIRSLNLKCRRVNLFIGAPNTGKSNILESIGVLSSMYHGWITEFVRLENMSNLFYDQNVRNRLGIMFDERKVEIEFKNDRFVGDYFDSSSLHRQVFSYTYDGVGSKSSIKAFESFKFYRFATRKDFPDHHSGYLNPPDGANLLEVVVSSKELRRVVTDLFNEFGYRLVLEAPEGKIKVMKDLKDIMISFPYSIASDTLQRLVFNLAVICSNEESVLSLEEPESHAFPYYTKYLAETVALDKNRNQYFISTHNPYFLISILEKTAKDEISVFITYLENYQTKAKPLKEKEIEEVLDLESDVFFNIERFLK